MKALADHKGLLFSSSIAPDGTTYPVDLSQLHPENKDMVWLHMCATHPDSEQYLRQCTKLDELVVNAMLADDTRPRTLERDGGLMLILRAMNLTQTGDPEDMISLRIWIDEKRIITTRRRDPLAIEDLKQMVTDQAAPGRAGQFLTAITDRVYSRMEPVLDDLEEAVNQLEESIAKQDDDAAQRAAPLRIKTAVLRRHILPQHGALSKLIKAHPDWLLPEDLEQLIESDDQITRYVESLNDMRDRLEIINDEITRQNDQRLSATNYLFTLAATIFLPLTFITGLLGVNIGGIPGIDNQAAFGFLIIFCVISVIIQIWYFRRKGWFQ